jgi:hypothetical protein
VAVFEDLSERPSDGAVLIHGGFDLLIEEFYAI